MLVEFSIPWVIALNILAWLVIQFGFAWSLTQLPLQRFDARGCFAHPRRWERGGRFYEDLLAIKRWKGQLPDASRMFRGGFAKGKLQTVTLEYLEQFLHETWRGELVHWLALFMLPLFAIWNPWWGVLVNAAVALVINLPCILALRYNRARFQRLITKRRLPANRFI